jgi:hypothetical protein
MLSLDKVDGQKPEDIERSIKSTLGDDLWTSVVAIGQFHSPRNWAIDFNNENAFSDAIGLNVEIGGKNFNFTDARKFGKEKNGESKEWRMYAYYRVHWLPNGFCIDELGEFLKQNVNGFKTRNMKILEITKEKSSIDDKVNNGIFNIKIEFQLESFDEIRNFAGFHLIDGLSALVQLSGMPPKCLFCERFGHIKRNCPDLKKLCQKCNKRGHLIANCNFAKSMFSRNGPEDEQDDAFLFNEDNPIIISDNPNPFLMPTATAPVAQTQPAAQAPAVSTATTTTDTTKKPRSRSSSTSSNRSNTSKSSGKQPLNDEEKAEIRKQKADAKKEKDRMARQATWDQAKTKTAEEFKATNEAALAASKKRSSSASTASNGHLNANSNDTSNPSHVQQVPMEEGVN